VADARLCLVLLAAGACGTLPDGSRWGERATPAPGWDRIAWAAERSALDPGTWIPAAGALVVGAGGFDERISDWARDHTPVFGSAEDADDASDQLKRFLGHAQMASVLLTPSDDPDGDWVVSKAKGFVVELAGEEATGAVTSGLKQAVGRGRPDDSNDRSFPSAHSSNAAASATMLSRNLDSIAMPKLVRTGLQVGTYGTAGAVAWARVEAGRHYPSDVLAGIALGRFFGSFVHDAFLGLPRDGGPKLEIAPQNGGVTVSVAFDF